ncbi:low molecular weight phosphotyrosine protein phosphatase [bacterium]|nr:low molecular weight phosphotyrosine protein phosphatase [bacterium]
MIKVIFVCLGNICRSPLGEGIFRHLVADAGLADRFEIDSAGTGNWHVGKPPHHGSQRVAKERGLDISGQRARQIQIEDLDDYDYVVAMDSKNLTDIRDLDPLRKTSAQVVRMMDFAPARGLEDVPDPYFGGPEGFDHVYELVEEASRGLLEHIAREQGLPLSTR